MEAQNTMSLPLARLYRSNDLNDLPFLKTQEGVYAREFLLPFMQNPTQLYISNVNTEMCCLLIDGHYLPVTINHAEYENSYVASPYGVILYSQEELKQFRQHWLAPALSALLKGTGKLLKRWNINQVVTVNNWFLSSNLYSPLSRDQIRASVDLLRESFPNHAILWRSLNTLCPDNLLSIFQNLPCRMIFTRQVYFFDPNQEERLSQKQRWNIKADGKLIAAQGYKVIIGNEIRDEDIPRLRELYDLLYVEKHNPFNPKITNDFLHLTIRKKLLNVLALYKENKIDGFLGYIAKENAMTSPLFGYDTHLPQEIGLYRMLTSLCIDEARRLKLRLNHGGGAAHFKRVRGMQAIPEYMAVFDQHLPYRRRWAWSGFATLFNNIGKPLFLHYKF